MSRIRTSVLVLIASAFAGMIGAAFGTGTAQAVVSTLVTAVNTSANPVQTQHVPADNPATQAVSLLCSPSQQTGSCNLMNGIDSTPYVVPTGKRLVVESISGDVLFPTGLKSSLIYTVQDNTPQNYSFYPPLNFVSSGAGVDEYSWGLSVKLYAEQGTSISVVLEGPFTASRLAYAFGHLENIQ